MQKQPQVKKELCRALDDVDVDVELCWFKDCNNFPDFLA